MTRRTWHLANGVLVPGESPSVRMRRRIMCLLPVIGNRPSSRALTYDEYVASLNPIAWWKMQETSGNIINYGSLSGIDGTPYGSPDYQWTGPSSTTIPYGINFDGGSEEFQFGWAGGLTFHWTDTFSVITWFKSNYADTTYRALIGRGGSCGGWCIRQRYDPPSFGFHLVRSWSANSIRVNTTGGPYNDNAWHLLVATYDGSKTAAGTYVYVDGIDRSNRVADGLTDDFYRTAYFRVAADDCNSHFPGVLTQIAIFDKALTASEISTLNTKGRA